MIFSTRRLQSQLKHPTHTRVPVMECTTITIKSTGLVTIWASQTSTKISTIICIRTIQLHPIIRICMGAQIWIIMFMLQVRPILLRIPTSSIHQWTILLLSHRFKLWMWQSILQLICTIQCPHRKWVQTCLHQDPCIALLITLDHRHLPLREFWPKLHLLPACWWHRLICQQNKGSRLFMTEMYQCPINLSAQFLLGLSFSQ